MSPLNKQQPQPEVNIGLVGHIAHGKTTLCEALTGKVTLGHSEELKRGITIRLGYADTTIRQCLKCAKPKCYTTSDKCSSCKSESKILRRVSFVDAPGHETLMATMLSGASMIDGAILVIAANEPCPQPQTREHLTALEISGIKYIIIVQNKVDLVSPEEAKKHYEQIKKFVKGSCAENAPIIPVCAQTRSNIDFLIQAIQEFIPTPKRDLTKDPIFLVARSFDVNRPGTDPTKITGGVLGGILKQGKLKKGDELELLPGNKTSKQNKIEWSPITTMIKSLSSGIESIEEALPGGNIGIATELDPSLTKSDNLAGTVAGLKGKMPPLFERLRLEVNLLKRIVGTEKELEMKPLINNESLMINAWTAKSLGVIASIKGKDVELVLKIPVCIEHGEKVAISRKIEGRWRLVGYGIVK